MLADTRVAALLLLWDDTVEALKIKEERKVWNTLEAVYKTNQIQQKNVIFHMTRQVVTQLRAFKRTKD